MRFGTAPLGTSAPATDCQPQFSIRRCPKTAPPASPTTARERYGLADLRDWRIRASREEVAKSLEGNWQKELLDDRRKAVLEGREAIWDWDSVKDSLDRKRG